MTEQDQQKALAELDGWTKHKHYDLDYPAWIPSGFNYDSDSSKGIYASPYNLIQLEHELPKWTSSYDAIIPIAVRIVGTIVITPETTPASVSELVLRKSGKWIDSKAV